MKHLILIITFCTLFLGANAQDSIELDGMKFDLKELKHYKPYVADSTMLKKLPKLKSKGIGNENLELNSLRVYSSKEKKSFAKSTYYTKDKNGFDLLSDSTSLKFFDEKGKLKWEKTMKGKSVSNCFLSPDGKKCIIELIDYLSDEPADENRRLLIFDENGETLLEHEKWPSINVSNSRDVVCYRSDYRYTGSKADKKTVYCFDLKTNTGWSKTFENDVVIMPASFNGDYIRIRENETIHNIYTRNGDFIVKLDYEFLKGRIDQISDDGKYLLVSRSAKHNLPTSFDVYDLSTLKYSRTSYYDVKEDVLDGRIYNGASFVQNSEYIIALTSIVAPWTGMVIFHDLDGKYLGHRVYENIKGNFYRPTAILLNDGSLDVYMNGEYFLDNIKLDNVNTLKYLKK